MHILTNVRIVLFIGLFCNLFSLCYAQVGDALLVKVTAIKEAVNGDSLKQQLPQLPDTLLPSFQKLDSIRSEFTLEADSIQQKYKRAVAEIETTTQTVNHTLDSLQKLDLPAGKYTRKLDSLHRVKNKFESKYRSRLDSLKAKTIGRLQSLDLPSNYKELLSPGCESLCWIQAYRKIHDWHRVEPSVCMG